MKPLYFPIITRIHFGPTNGGIKDHIKINEIRIEELEKRVQKLENE